MNQFKIAFIIILTILSNFIIAQPENLVPNPSFEEYSQCPTTASQITRAIGWRSVNFSPDYIHECSTSPTVDVPKNAWGYQYPHSGSAYVNCNYYANPSFPKFEKGNGEILSTKLKEKLEINKRYFVTFFVNRANGGSIYASPVPSFFCINKIGALFSTKDYSLSVISDYYYYCNLCTLPNFAHVYTNQIICDTLNWIEVSGSFIADSAYEYINIGVFFDINHLDTHIVKVNTENVFIVHHFIDDIYVGTVPYHEAIEYNNFVDINFFENKLIVKLRTNTNCKINIYDILGKTIYKEETENKEIYINMDFVKEGIYLVEVNSGKYNIKKKILKL